MKHNIKITLILIAMFILTQLIGLAVINAYSPKTKTIFNETSGEYENITTNPQLPYGTQPPEIKPAVSLTSIIISFAIAVFLIFLLMKIKAVLFLRLWFFFVVMLAMGVTLNSLLLNFSIYSSVISIVVALPLAFYKIFKHNLLVHNLTELLIYPGIAAIFVPILSLWSIIILLILISAYDIYAVWHSGFMQKMAKFQINKLKLFAGFFVPYIGRKARLALKKGKKGKKGKKIKVSLAILGGGDVVFPIMTAGVVLKTLGLATALFVILGASLALLWLFIFARKGRFYPAMPFITSGCLFGLSAGLLASLI